MTEQSAAPARDLILDAAESLFARKGFDPTTIKEIGAEAGLNPALLYYYFANKETLYRAVLQRIISAMVAQGGTVLDAARTPPDTIRALVAAQLQFILGHPNAPRLIVRELIDHEARHAEAMIPQVAAGIFQRLCALIEEGQRQQLFRQDVQPRFAAVSIVAQVVYFMLARPAVGIFFGMGPRGITDAMARDFGVHAGEFALGALSIPEQSA